MRVIFNPESLAGALRRPYVGSDVKVLQRADGFQRAEGCYVVEAADGETFGAYGDELILVPPPKPGDAYVCPDCGSSDEWHVWYQASERQDGDVRVGGDGRPFVYEYLGNSESADCSGDDEMIECNCGYHEEFPQVKHPDSAAMESIHRLLSGKVWDSESIELVAAIVAKTGRAIEPPG